MKFPVAMILWCVVAFPVAAERPNILLIHCDDLRHNALGYAGDPIAKTPNLDQLARKGTNFPNSFVTTSICGVSRACLFTGQWQRRHGCPGFAKQLPEAQWKESYPALLRAAGYHIGFIGKIGVGDSAPQKGDWEKRFDFYRGLPGQAGGEFIDPKDPKKQHKTALFGDQSLEFFQGVPADKPFALQVSFNAPHARDGKPREFTPDTRDETLFQDTTMPVPPLATPEAFASLPEFLQNSEGRRRWKPRFEDPKRNQETLRDYYRLVTGIDREVGRMIEDLTRSGKGKNTVLIFTSDNGFSLGDRGLADKWTMFEESIRVPLLIVDLRETDASRCRVESLVLNVDLAPTILGLAGLPIPKSMQGRSLVPFLKRYIPMDWRQGFFYEHHAGMKNIPPSEGIRTERYKYIRWLQPTEEGIAKGEARLEQLFDLEEDPLEQKDASEFPKHAKLMEQMRQVWERERKALR